MCIGPLAQGCFFFLPFIEEKSNVPPVIISSSPDEGETLELDLEARYAHVVVEDEDGDATICLWSMSRLGELGPGEPLLTSELAGCRMSVEPDPTYDGQTLVVQVFDPSYEYDERSWPIDVLGVGP